ncbi:MAG: FAD-dependent oxidoreductase [Pseudomonadota bacterium]
MRETFTILGCGVAGLCVGAELQSRGCGVNIIDPSEGPGPHGCSWWAGGMLAPDCEGAVAEGTIVNLGREAASWWEGQGAEVSYSGSLVVALDRDKRELDRFARRTENHDTLDRTGIAELEPQLAERFERALFMHAEAHLNPRNSLSNLQEKLKANGAAFSAAGEVNDKVIDCRGLAAKDVLPDLRGVKGEMVVLSCPEVELKRPIRLLHPRFPLYIVPRGDGVFMLGATQIESGERGRATVRSVVELLNAAYALHPAFGEAEVLEIGVDARPAFPDNLPRISKIRDQLFVNGLFRHGFLLAPAMARMVADYVMNGEEPEVWHAYSS